MASYDIAQFCKTLRALDGLARLPVCRGVEVFEFFCAVMGSAFNAQRQP